MLPNGFVRVSEVLNVLQRPGIDADYLKAMVAKNSRFELCQLDGVLHIRALDKHSDPRVDRRQVVRGGCDHSSDSWQASAAWAGGGWDHRKDSWQTSAAGVGGGGDHRNDSWQASPAWVDRYQYDNVHNHSWQASAAWADASDSWRPHWHSLSSRGSGWHGVSWNSPHTEGTPVVPDATDNADDQFGLDPDATDNMVKDLGKLRFAVTGQHIIDLVRDLGGSPAKAVQVIKAWNNYILCDTITNGAA